MYCLNCGRTFEIAIYENCVAACPFCKSALIVEEAVIDDTVDIVHAKLEAEEC